MTPKVKMTCPRKLDKNLRGHVKMGHLFNIEVRTSMEVIIPASKVLSPFQG